MKKLKLLMAALVLMLGWSNAWADDVIDITSTRLTNANLSSLTGWTFDDSFSAEGNDYTDYKTDGAVNVVEFYSEWAESPGAMASSKNFKMTQTITLSAGTYRLSAYGFYREKNGDGTNTKAYLKAGTNQSYINGLSSDGLSSYTGSNDLYKAANAFSRGDFNNTLEFTLDSKQDIEVGIVGTFNTQKSWCVVGPMSLVKIMEGGIELTEVIVNPSFETGDMTGWIASGATNDPPVPTAQLVSNKPLTNASGDYVCNYQWWCWSNDTSNPNGISQNIGSQPAGNYRVTAVLGAPNGWTVKLYANNENVSSTMTSDYAGAKLSVDITLDGSTDLVIKAIVASSSTAWEEVNMRVDDFRLFNLDHYYDALNAAITAAEGHVLGFDAGEYAPYNNTAAISALNAAKAVDQREYIDWDELQTIVSNLTSAIWTANVAEVNAFAYGDFGTYETINGEDMPYGWNLYNGENNHSRIMGGTQGSENAGLSASSTEKALLLKWNATYGESQGYTMPLNAATLYKITFKYCGWGGNSPHTNIVMTDPNASNITLNPAFEPIGSHGDQTASEWTTFTGYFVSTTAGNYKFNLNKEESGQQQIAIADIELKSSNDALNFADGSVPTYAPGTYPSVKITRTLTADRWATAIYPFAVSGVNYIAVFDRYNDGTEVMGFSSAVASPVNKPFLMKSTTNKSEISLENVAVAATDATDVTYGNASLKGVYATTTVKESDNAYVISANEIRPASSDGAIVNPYRAYIQVAGVVPGARGLSFVIDDEETTAIDGLETVKNENMKVYNLNGQRVEKPGKGLYIVNGKKLLVK